MAAAPDVTILALDFKAKVERRIEPAEMARAMEGGEFLWIDVKPIGTAEAKALLEGTGLIAEEVIDAALTKEPATQHARYDDYVHLVVAGLRQRGGDFQLDRVDAVIGEQFFFTIHRGEVPFLDAMRRSYRKDFVRFARGPSFLLFALWDHLVEHYLSIQMVMEDRVEALQLALRSERLGGDVFARVAALGADLLHFRKILLPARAVLADLSTRRSMCVSEVTQAALSNLAGTLEHVLQDLLVDRDVLSNALNLHLSIVSHRTNEVMKRLTVVSVVFLPLTFLVGVYGMNFDVMPELRWTFGYPLFWAAALLIVGAILTFLRRAKLL
jgi:magnesium transporter